MEQTERRLPCSRAELDLREAWEEQVNFADKRETEMLSWDGKGSGLQVFGQRLELPASP